MDEWGLDLERGYFRACFVGCDLVHPPPDPGPSTLGTCGPRQVRLPVAVGVEARG